MSVKKAAFSKQLFSLRRKVVSRFGLGVGVSLVILSLLSINNNSPVRKSSVDSYLFRSSPFSFPIASFSSSTTRNVSAPALDSENIDNRLQSEIPKEANARNKIEKILLKNQIREYEPKKRSFTTRNSSLQVKPHGGKVNDELDEVVNKEEQLVTGSSCCSSRIVENQKWVNLSQNGGNLAEKIDPKLTRVGSKSYEECDFFDGRWVRDDTKPYYPAGSCPIERNFDCHLNKRPDDGYMKWKWQPNGCHLPSLNATDFLERLRGKKVVFVGDSLNRNMWESLVCILRHGIRDKKQVYEISGKEFNKKGFYSFRFEDYNCSIGYIKSPFLVRRSSFKGKNGSIQTLRLDLMDQTTALYHDADILVFNTGHWWTNGKTSRGKDYYQEGDYVHPRLEILDAYKRALTTLSRWIDKNIDVDRTKIFFTGHSPTHFRGGRWNSGGKCHKETEPILNENHKFKYPSKMRALEHVFKEMKTPITYLNISRLTDYRKDGHPSIYREYQTEEERIEAERWQDCSHWCLPGVPDTWNELLYATLLKVRNGRVWGN